MDDYIVGRNAVREALRSGRSIQRLLVSEEARQGSILEILAIAKEQGIEIRRVPEKQMSKYAGQVPHQGVAALLAGVTFQDLDEVLAAWAGKPEGNAAVISPETAGAENSSRQPGKAPLLVLTDGVEDPHNMGAIIRTAECAGATAVLIPKRHNAPINTTVAKTSAGAIEFVPLVQVGNVAQAIKRLKEQGFWVLGADMKGEQTMYEADLTAPIVLVIGNEGKGLSRLTKELCDVLVTIPMYGQLNSLNASVAAALLLYEAVRQRQ